MAFKDYDSFDAIGLADLVRKGQVTAKELLDEAVARTAKVDPEINAVVVKHYDYAERQITNGLADRPFTGVPFLLKDLDLLAGTRTTFGASVYENDVADHTGTLAQRFLDAGLTIFGKSASPEFGLMPTTESRLFGPTRNPWNLAHSSGGSSGGAAAAVAARILPVAHASDGGGSIRIPASACGVFGLKPTRARNPIGPDRGEGWSGFSCGHVVSISVRDSAAMMDAVSGPEPTSPYRAPPPERPFAEEVGRDPGRLRIAFTDKSPYGDAIDPEIAAAVRDAARLLSGLGHHVEERAPQLAADPAPVMSTIVTANTALNVRVAEQRFGRAMTDQDFEVLTLASAYNAKKAPAPTTSPPSAPPFRSRVRWPSSLQPARCSFARPCALRRCALASWTRCRRTCRISRRRFVAICPRPRCSTCPASPLCRFRWRGIPPDCPLD
jgi:amidase